MRIPSKNGDFEKVVVERGNVGGLVPFLAQKSCLGVSSIYDLAFQVKNPQFTVTSLDI